MNFEIDETPFENILRLPLPEPFEWEGDLDLKFGEKSLRGSGFMRAGYGGQRGAVVAEDPDLKNAKGPVAIGFGYSPGVMLAPNKYGTCRPVNNANWVADGCMIDGRKLGGLVSEFRFGYSSLEISGPAQESPAHFLRFIYQSAHLSSPAAYTVWKDDKGFESRLDAISGTFQARRIALRNLHTEKSVREEQYVSAVLENDSLNGPQSHALWLLVSFLSGNTVTPICRENYDINGNLVSRKFKRGVPASLGRFSPFRTFHAQLDGRDISVIGDALVRMNRTGFPVDVVLQHLHDANSGNFETDAQSILLGIHTAIEAWNREFGTRHFVDAESWSLLSSQMLERLRPILDPLGNPLGETVRNKIRSANHTSTNSRERDLFGALAVPLSKRSKQALNARNQLLHNGYFLRRFGELTSEEQQERIDLPGLLRNLLHEIILKLCGFRGVIMESSRFETLRIESLFSPLFRLGPHHFREQTTQYEPYGKLPEELRKRLRLFKPGWGRESSFVACYDSIEAFAAACDSACECYRRALGKMPTDNVGQESARVPLPMSREWLEDELNWNGQRAAEARAALSEMAKTREPEVAR
ncbi:MAG TPA: hypothetical protein VFW34_05485 [Candidatus Rubrimentiphilum sp.]|nr:hypothetical protein [Candidatus Rubrimentiphilum sp.]